MTFGPNDLQTNTGESDADTWRVLAGMLDILVARTVNSSHELRSLAAPERLAVVNAMTADEHPTQALADLTTLHCRFGAIDGCRVLYVGEGNSTAAALALALTRFDGVELELRTPPGYGLPEPIRVQAERQAKSNAGLLVEQHTMHNLPKNVNVIYTTRWRTTGTAKADPGWRATFHPFRVGNELWETSPDAVFMHDLPAHRGDEVSADVLDGPASIAFEQARNKMYSAMAVLEWCRASVPGEQSL